MNACIFVGPTLGVRDDTQGTQALWLPPVKQGDVYRAVSLLRPEAIGIVDGYFQWVPSVLHKEILWAMKQGVHVFGAASMGALRAAELASFGMHGVGRIFEAYRRGVLPGYPDEAFEDDDEVAVVHGPGESGYLPGSEAMVNIRCTLVAAERAGAISKSARMALASIAKGLFYADRSYERMIERADAKGLPGAELSAFRAWLPSGRVNQKRLDAAAMLQTMHDFLASQRPPPKVTFDFEATTLWERLRAAAEPITVHDADDERVLAELRLEPASWRALRDEIVRPALSAEKAATRAGFLAQRPQEAETERTLHDLAKADARRRLADDVPPAFIELQMLERLRHSADFERLRARADDKAALLKSEARLPPIDAFTELKLLELRDWYFCSVLLEDMPEDLDGWVSAAGYVDLAHFHRSLFGEYVYRRAKTAATARANA